MTEPVPNVDNGQRLYPVGKEAVPALRGVVGIRTGGLLCLMGVSNSGKTTLLSIIGGLDGASRGRLTTIGGSQYVIRR